MVGHFSQAQDAWQQALAIFEDLQHPHADQVRAKLDGVDEPGELAGGSGARC